ncbi:MAG: hypothetical protein JSV24_10650 [Bacteroidales bacterium]|nr:MAG: hypothetical protein JSV24_10650 [Bacteroidales bacterium]
MRKVYSRIMCLAGTIFLAVLFACSDDEYDRDPGPTDIRIRNLSTKIYDSIEVNTSGGINMYGIVNPDAESNYKRFDEAYPKADISVYIDGVEYTYGPVDYTYAVWLGKGKFSYEVWITDTINHVLDMRVGDDIYPLDDL